HQLRARDIPLRVPFAAVVAERLHNPGEQVTPGEALLELFDPRTLYVLAQVPVESAARVAAGMPVTGKVDGSTARRQVGAVAAALVPQSLTVPVRVSLTAPLQPALLHAAVECEITTADHADALLIPRTALVSSGSVSGTTVMVAVNNQARRRTVEIGLR